MGLNSHDLSMESDSDEETAPSRDWAKTDENAKNVSIRGNIFLTIHSTSTTSINFSGYVHFFPLCSF